jgi:23S rRNA pseudouridine2604 synthase
MTNSPFASEPASSNPPADEGRVRLSKRMSELGLCSRREADSLIEKGWVFVDGVAIKELGTKIFPNQKITLNRAAQTEQQSRVTVLINKPLGYVSGQPEPPHTPAVVLIHPKNQYSDLPQDLLWHASHMKGLAPAGRLDIDSTGLLVMTQDGRVAKLLIGENSAVDKEYLVRVSGKIQSNGLELLRHGLTLDGVKLKPALVEWQNEDQLHFTLWEGRNRQIRRMCELVGLNVVALKRVRIGKVVLGNLPLGSWRYLGAHESFS